MTQYNSSSPKEAIKVFLKEALSDLKSGKTDVTSRHIDEIIPNLPAPKEAQLKIAAELYKELVEQYSQYSSDLMAVLVLGTDYEDTLEKHSLGELLEGELELYPPPELYLVKRSDARDEPYIVEEYKLPIKQTFISTKSGIVYAYYKTIRNEQRDIYLGGFYFEHYAEGSIEHDWN